MARKIIGHDSFGNNIYADEQGNRTYEAEPKATPPADTNDYTGDQRFKGLNDLYWYYNGRALTNSEYIKYFKDSGQSLQEIGNYMTDHAELPTMKFGTVESPEATAAEDAAETTAPTYQYELTPEMQKIVDSVNDLASKVPEFTPEMVTKWQPIVDQIYAPYEKQAVKALGEQYNALSPYSYGSGKQMEAMNTLYADVVSNKAAKALSLGTMEYEKNLNVYSTAVNKSIDLAGMEQAGKKFTSEQDTSNYWKEMQRGWDLADAQTQQNYYTSLASQYTVPEKEWWEDLITPVATLAGYAVAGPLGATVGSQIGNIGTNYMDKYKS